MSAKKFVVLLLILTCVQIALLPHSVQASHCRHREDDLLEADVIFSGRVTKVERVNEQKLLSGLTYEQIVTFRVQNTWKGTLQSQVVVRGGPSIGRDCGVGGCGYTFKHGRSYLVFAYGDPANDVSADICSRTALLSSREARQDLAALGPGQLPAGGSSTDQGIVPLFAIALMLTIIGFRLRWLGQANTARK
jgi:hypothetical protein